MPEYVPARTYYLDLEGDINVPDIDLIDPDQFAYLQDIRVLPGQIIIR